MFNFFRNVATKESAFRAAVGGFGAALMQYPDLFANLPEWVGPAAIIAALVTSSGDKTEEVLAKREAGRQ